MTFEKDDKTAEIEATLGNVFERFIHNVRGLVDLLDNAIPAVLRQQERWDDVANIGPDLLVAPASIGEFAEIWESEYGTRQFDAIVQPRVMGVPGSANNIGKAAGETGDTGDVGGHSTGPQPEEAANYRSAVVEFLSKHGSVSALQKAIRNYYSGMDQILTIAQSSIVFAVGSLEAVVADCERIRLQTHQAAIGTGEKEFTLNDLIRLGDIDAVVRVAVDRRVERLCYGNLGEWATWFKKSFGVDLEVIALDWANIQRVVQDRHVIVHNEGRVSRLYLERTGTTEFKLGETIDLSPQYIYKVLDEIMVLGVMIVSVAWEKLGNDLDHHLGHLLNRSYDALVDQRNIVALAMSERIIELCPATSLNGQIAKVNRWIALKGMGVNIEAELSAWDVDALAPRFAIAKAVLLGEFDDVEARISIAIESGELSRDSLVAWPLFRDLREQPVFARILENLEQV